MNLNTISSQLYLNTVKIETSTETSQGSGTGFIFDYSSEPETSCLFLITNRHVVENTKDGKILFHVTEENNQEPSLEKGFYLTIPDWQCLWFYHPNPEIDIAICPFLPIIQRVKEDFKQNLFFKAIPRKAIPDQDEINSLNAMEEVIFVGYPNGMWDSIHNLPILRKGITASPLQINFENRPQFLIDASVFGGSSGSPLFIVNDGAYLDKGSICFGSRFYFLGVVSAVYFRTQINNVEARTIPTSIIPVVENKEMIDLGIVFKSQTILDTIDIFLKQNPHLE